MQVDEKFREALLKIKGQIMCNGKETTMIEITEKIIEAPAFKDVEKQIIEGVIKLRKIKMDGRLW